MVIAIEFGDIIASIEKHKLDSLQNAANGLGKPMGRGIAKALKDAGGKEVEDDAYAVCRRFDPKAGEAYSSTSGKLQIKGIKRIIHAVTMKVPGGETSYDIVSNAFKAALELAQNERIVRLGCTSLGTGVGGLDGERVAEIMYKIAKDSPIEIVFMDFNTKFIKKLEELHGKV